MVPKVLIGALLCLVLTQVQGDPLQHAINHGIAHLKKSTSTLETAAAQYKRQAESKINELKLRSKNLLEEGQRTNKFLMDNLELIAEEAKRNATAANKPPATLDCIVKAKTRGTNSLQSLGTKYRNDLIKLSKTTFTFIEQECFPLTKIKVILREKCRQYEEQIRKCDSVPGVHKITEKMKKDYEGLNSNLRRIVNQVNKTLGYFKKSSDYVSSSASRKQNKAMVDGALAIKKCLV